MRLEITLPLVLGLRVDVFFVRGLCLRCLRCVSCRRCSVLSVLSARLSFLLLFAPVSVFAAMFRLCSSEEDNSRPKS